ncbi:MULTISPECIES: hypothetical protein [unclassified Streptomyces]|uniref:hypothetical protein n=1 Tax=unclassified Streptomyces TaxID=2593676 RepID=UPI000DAD063B|nr:MULTISPECIES: hypothetical protein [unclassified Streptomyces]PZT77566.1 hypothetical protein DNK56_30815 [Streptomyces sp. AC1-42W]PZT78480.1 hypothetical protein DNK55_01870 [Streptomyces sp. AC1-42T]WUC96800.1 hypothetical protein OG710_25720 [Streptomyces sp. NBC_00525]
MTKNTTTRNALRAAFATVAVVIVTGIGVQAGWADDASGTGTQPTGTSSTATPAPTTTGSTDNNPWD